MIFSKKEITVAYTVSKCNSCQKQHTRKFKDGDSLFAELDSCQCGGLYCIDLIYGQTFKQ